MRVRRDSAVEAVCDREGGTHGPRSMMVSNLVAVTAERQCNVAWRASVRS